MTEDGLCGQVGEWGVKPRAVLSGTLFVNQAFRRQGIAQCLLRAAEAHARLWGVGELVLIVKERNTAALKLYEKLGYKRHPQKPEHGPEVCMSRQLWQPNLHTLRSLLPLPTMVTLF